MVARQVQDRPAAELENAQRLAVYVDPGRPNAWKEEPFFSTLKNWAVQFVPLRTQLVVYVGRRAIVIFPDHEVDLGIFADDELILTRERHTPAGIELEAIKMKKDDPRAASLALKR